MWFASSSQRKLLINFNSTYFGKYAIFLHPKWTTCRYNLTLDSLTIYFSYLFETEVKLIFTPFPTLNGVTLKFSKVRRPKLDLNLHTDWKLDF